jgi:hypothetical protein
MALGERTSIRRYWMAAIAGGVCTALAAAIPGVAWGQDAGDSAVEAMAPGGMQMMMGRRRPGRAHRPRFSSGRGCLHHDRSLRCRR